MYLFSYLVVRLSFENTQTVYRPWSSLNIIGLYHTNAAAARAAIVECAVDAGLFCAGAKGRVLHCFSLILLLQQLHGYGSLVCMPVLFVLLPVYSAQAALCLFVQLFKIMLLKAPCREQQTPCWGQNSIPGSSLEQFKVFRGQMVST